MISWSIVASCQARLTGRATFFLTRSLLGIIEGGFIPDIVLYMSYFYKSKELPVRLSFFWGAYGLTFIISAFLAYGILHLGGRDGLLGWQWLFALEGGLTALLGILSWYKGTMMGSIAERADDSPIGSISLLHLIRQQVSFEGRVVGSLRGRR